MKERFAVAAVMVAMFLAGEARADDIAPIPTSTQTSQGTVAVPDKPAMDLRPGDVLTVGQDSGLSKVDMGNFYVLPIEWQPASPGSVQYGLRADGVVMWRKAK